VRPPVDRQFDAFLERFGGGYRSWPRTSAAPRTIEQSSFVRLI
jgi:hypothetical protein